MWLTTRERGQETHPWAQTAAVVVPSSKSHSFLAPPVPQAQSPLPCGSGLAGPAPSRPWVPPARRVLALRRGVVHVISPCAPPCCPQRRQQPWVRPEHFLTGAAEITNRRKLQGFPGFQSSQLPVQDGPMQGDEFRTVLVLLQLPWLHALVLFFCFMTLPCSLHPTHTITRVGAADVTVTHCHPFISSLIHSACAYQGPDSKGETVGRIRLPIELPVIGEANPHSSNTMRLWPLWSCVQGVVNSGGIQSRTDA